MLRSIVMLVGCLAICLVDVSQADDPPEAKPSESKSQALQRIRQALDTRVDYALDEQSLEEFVEFLRKKYDVPVVVDALGIREGLIETDSPMVAKCDMRGVRLRTLLNSVHNHLSWLIHDEVIWITTTDIAKDMVETRVYDVRDLVEVDGNTFEFNAMIDLIMNTIAPDEWTATGGPGSIERFRSDEIAALVIRTTQRVHEQIEELLANLRALRKGEAKKTSQTSKQPEPIKALVLEEDPRRDVVVAANNEFALDLYSQLRQKKGNVIASPYNISTALAMAYAGARNQTAQEMATAMHWPMPVAGLPGEDFHEGFQSLQSSLQGLDTSKGYELRSANRVWCKQGLKLEAPFLLTTRDNYGAEASLVDFGSPRTVPMINDWIAKNTGGQIKELIKQLPRQSALVLTSAIYFNGKWAIPFQAKDTKPQRFNLGNSLLEVPFMDQKDRHGYAEIEGFQVLEKPYRGNALSMVILLPTEKAGALEALETSLSAEKVNEWLGKLQTRRVHVLLPKFKFETEVDLKGTLQQLGMQRAFSQASADFSGVAHADGKSEIYLDQVLHKATIDVGEEGTKATAATVVIQGFAASMVRPPQIPIFLANRPFLFLIRDLRTGCILFMGRLAEPEGIPLSGQQPSLRVIDSN